MYGHLIPLAHEAIAEDLRGNAVSRPREGMPAQACFVSLKLAGRLRGCIGTLRPSQSSLEAEVQANAVAAATRDPRFMPVEPADLAGLRVSIDVLSAGEPVDDMRLLNPVRYGLIVRSGSRCGVLLPDIKGVETVDQQVQICLEKAGIRPGKAFSMERFVVERVEE